MKKSTTQGLHLILALTAIFFLSVPLASSQSTNKDLGINFSFINDYSSELVFVDLFKTSRYWVSHRFTTYLESWDDGRPIDVDTEGWPRSLQPNQAAGTIMLTGLGANYPAGEYVCLYEGEGTIVIDWDATVVSQQPGRIVVNRVPREGVHLMITAINPANPIRHIRFVMPGHEQTYQTQPFYPPFLEWWKDFKIIRFMDWQETNFSPVREWSQRRTLNSSTYNHEAGAALELMIALANTLQADPWFCMPHLASDDYVRQFAQMVEDRLDPNLTAYVEHSNEVWNSIFTQHQYASERGLALGLTDNPWWAAIRYHSQRSVEIFQIWEDVFGGPSPRFKRVLGAMVWDAVCLEIAGWNNAYQHADAIAIAPYFGGYLGYPNQVGRVLQMSMDELLNLAQADIDTVIGWSKLCLDVANEFNLELITYESGQHLAAVWEAVDNPAFVDKLIAANRHPRMYDLYADYLRQWQRLGAGTMTLYSSMVTPSKWGSWGLLEYHNQDTTTAPKYRAAIDFIRRSRTAVTGRETSLPESFQLLQNSPNPFNPVTSIQYSVVGNQFVSLRVYDVLGREVATLVNEKKPAGVYRVSFDAENLPSGVYLYRLRAGDPSAGSGQGFVATRKMLLTR